MSIMTLSDESLRPLLGELKKPKHRRLTSEEAQNRGFRMARTPRITEETASRGDHP